MKKLTSQEEFNRRRVENVLGTSGLRVHERRLNFFEREERRNLTLGTPNKVEQQYSSLSFWEKLFVQSFYEERVNAKPNKGNRYEKVRADISNELEKLYKLAEDEKYFKIDTENNKYLEREFTGEINALRARGEGQTADYFEKNKEQGLKDISNKISNTQFEEYKHIVSFIKQTNYEPAFKALMLHETLSKIYKQVTEENKTKTIVEKRIPHKSIAGHMVLNDVVLKTIYEKAKDSSNFADLYFEAISLSNEKSMEKSVVDIDEVETYGKGKWIRFKGKQNCESEEEYLKNAQELSALVQNTSWCTKTLASSQLEQGDFFVFVDNENQPHIAVKMHGNTVDEVRGLVGANLQELEEEYRDVALSFLENNKELEGGKRWLEKEEWNKRLVAWNKKIENGTFKECEIESLFKDITKVYNELYSKNSNRDKLLDNLYRIRPQLAKYLNCDEDDIYKSIEPDEEKIFTSNLYKYDKDGCHKIPCQESCDILYKAPIILGDLDFMEIDYNLFVKHVMGSVVANNSCGCKNQIGLESIRGNAYFMNSLKIGLDDLESIGGNAYFNGSQINSLKNLKSIGGDIYLTLSRITNLDALESIGGYADFSYSEVTSFKSLKSIGGSLNLDSSEITSLDNIKSIDGSVIFRDSKITDFGKLEYIGGSVFFGEDDKELEEKFLREFKHNKITKRFERKPEFLKLAQQIAKENEQSF